MAIESTSKFKVFYCGTSLPTSGLNVGGLYVFRGSMYLADSTTTTIKLDGIRAGDNTAMLAASGIAGDYWFNSTDGILYWWDTTLDGENKAKGWTASNASKAKNLSQDVAFTLGTGVTGSGTLSAGSNAVTLSVTAIDPTKITAGALVDGMTATTQTAGDNSTKLATTAFVKKAVDDAAVAVMHYKGTVANTTALAAVVSPAVGDVYNLSSDGSNWAYSAAADYTPSGTAGTDYIAIGDPATGYWEKLGSTLDTSDFALKSQANTFTAANTFSGGATVASGLGTDTLTVSSTSTFSDDVTLSGATTDLTVGGNISGSGTLGVAGATTIGSSTTASSFKVYGTAEATGNTTIGGTLGVTGATTVTSLNATGAVDFDSTLNVDGAATFGAGATISSGNLTVSTGGVTVTTGDVTITAGDLTVGDQLSVGGTSTFADDVTIGGTGTGEDADLTVNGAATITGNATVGGTLGVTGKSTLGAVDVDGAADFDGTVDMTGSSSVSLGANATATTKAANSGLSNDTATKTAVATVEYVDAAVTAGLTWSVVN